MKSAVTSDLIFLSTLLMLVTCLLDVAMKIFELLVLIGTITYL